MASRPLYRGAYPEAPKLPQGAHAGLWYDKMCIAIGLEDKGAAGKKQGESDELRWIKTVTGDPVGNGGVINEYTFRQCCLVEALGGELISVKSTSRFVTGLGREHPVDNGFAWHPVLGTPYLPGSSIKGMVRAWARGMGAIDPEDIECIFGNPEHVGAVAILDAIPVAPVRLAPDVMTPHYSPYYQGGEIPGDWHNPIPIPFLTVAPGMQLQLGVVPLGPGGAELARAVRGWVERAFIELGAGAKTAVGYGRFERCAAVLPPKEWREAARERRRAAMSVEERAGEEVAGMDRQQALDCLRDRIHKGSESDIQYREALREALHRRFHDVWDKDGIEGLGRKKVLEYLAWLRGEPSPGQAEAAEQRAAASQGAADRQREIKEKKQKRQERKERKRRDKGRAAKD